MFQLLSIYRDVVTVRKRQIFIQSTLMLVLIIGLFTSDALHPVVVEPMSIATPDAVMAALSPVPMMADPQTELSRRFSNALLDRFPDIPDDDLPSALFSVRLRRQDYAFSLNYVSVVQLEANSGERWYLIYDKAYDDPWKLEGLVTNYNDHDDDPGPPLYRVETDAWTGRFWLVFTTETNHGTGELQNDEMWYNPDGSLALEYDHDGFADIAHYADNTGAYHTAGVEYDGDSTLDSVKNNDPEPMIYVSYVTNFTFDDKPLFFTRDTATYIFDPDTNRFVAGGDKGDIKSTLGPAKPDAPLGAIYETIPEKYRPDINGVSDSAIAAAATAAGWEQVLLGMGVKNVTPLQ